MAFNIVVLAKQVPDTAHVGANAMKEDGTLNRAALPAVFNPDDLNALELALQVKDRQGASVTVLTMGPPQASEILRDALSRGAGRAVLLSDMKFAASDTLATSYVLAQAISLRLSPFDLIICGRQAIDGDTAQVGPQVAEKLGIPQVTYTEEITGIEKRSIRLRRNLERAHEEVKAPLPVLLTVTGGANRPRWPNARLLLKYRKARSEPELEKEARTQHTSTAELREKLAAKDRLIETWGVNELKTAAGRIGLSGSPTKVKKIESVVLGGKDLKLFNPDDSGVRKLVEQLEEDKILGALTAKPSHEA